MGGLWDEATCEKAMTGDANPELVAGSSKCYRIGSAMEVEAEAMMAGLQLAYELQFIFWLNQIANSQSLSPTLFLVSWSWVSGYCSLAYQAEGVLTKLSPHPP